MTDIYSLQFDPQAISIKQEELGLHFADLDTAVDLMKKEEKMIVAELTIYYTRKGGYKNMTELNGYINSDNKIKDFAIRYEKVLKERNRSKIRYDTFKSFSDNLRTKMVNERELAKNL